MESDAGFNATIVRTKEGPNGKKYYKYEDQNFSIINQQLTEGELESLSVAVEIFGRAKGLSGFEWMGELETKLKDKIDKDTKLIISFDDNPDLVGIEYLQDLYKHIKDKEALSITYQSFKKDEPQIITMHPYYLKQHNKRWFLFGENDDSRKLQNLALDRIKGFEISSTKYITNKKYNFDEYFDEIIGVTTPEGAVEEEIHLHFSKERLPYVISKPIHQSQKTSKGDDIIRLKLKKNKEFISLLLSYGSDLTVISPQSLKDEIKNHIEKMKKNYE